VVRQVAAGSVQAGDKSNCDWIEGCGEEDRKSRGLCGERRSSAARAPPFAAMTQPSGPPAPEARAASRSYCPRAQRSSIDTLRCSEYATYPRQRPRRRSRKLPVKPRRETRLPGPPMPARALLVATLPPRRRAA
jgi:hypothetical protein